MDWSEYTASFNHKAFDLHYYSERFHWGAGVNPCIFSMRVDRENAR